MLPIFVTNLGMVTSLGLNAIHTCAAIRAGVSRPHPIEEIELVDPMTLDPISLVGHPIRGFAEGFNLVAFWLRVASGAFADCKLRLPKAVANSKVFWNETALIAATPYLDGDRFLMKDQPSVEVMKEAYLLPLRDLLQLSIPDGQLHLVSRGNTSTANSLMLANQLIQGRQVKNAMIIAADSYLDSLTLEWLAANRRLKSPNNPAGLAPGEAGVCLLVEGGPVEFRNTVRIQAIANAIEPATLESQEPNLGQGLADAIRLVLSQTQVSAIFTGDIVSDQNGEFWRAQELAYARLAVRDVVDMNSRVILPAVAVGDTGAASGAIAVCVAMRALARSYSTNNELLVLSSTERGDVSALMLRAA